MTKSAKTGKSGGSGASRRLAVKLKTAKGRKTGSTRWLQRQLNDPYVAEAKRLGFRSRAAFKLLEIDDKYHLLQPGMAVVDLGAAPGGWSQIAAERVKATDGAGRVAAADINEFEPLAGVETMQLDIESPDAEARLLAALGGTRADIVMSDMAAPAMGHKQTDHLRIIGLVEVAYDVARHILAPGGTFLAKVFQGGAGQELMAHLNADFDKVRHVKPKASRQDSAEMYVLATGFRGGAEE
jgi:23S rRNA (uridine2552-2'-O)-methyltransferase